MESDTSGRTQKNPDYHYSVVIIRVFVCLSSGGGVISDFRLTVATIIRNRSAGFAVSYLFIFC